jgi:predicted AAA+ superfamily ATPase
MEKQAIKKLIAERQQEILKVALIERPLELEATLNYVFVGLRRAGKSYFLYQHVQHLIKTGQATIDDILYVNFEDERIAAVKAEELGLFLECYNEMFDGKPFIFLDEIQNVAGWEKFARRLADSKYRVFVTGSNANMLSHEIYTTLGGRFLVKEVFPFSFREYLAFHKVVLGRDTVVGFLQCMTEAHLVFNISNFSDKMSSKETLKKRYFFDNGLLNNLLFDPETKLLENLVAITLKRQYGEELYFYNKNVEVDFFVPDAYRAIQVSYSIADDLTRQREVCALQKLAGVYELKQLEIITYDEEATIEENGVAIQVVPIWKWLLG